MWKVTIVRKFPETVFTSQWWYVCKESWSCCQTVACSNPRMVSALSWSTTLELSTELILWVSRCINGWKLALVHTGVLFSFFWQPIPGSMVEILTRRVVAAGDLIGKWVLRETVSHLRGVRPDYKTGLGLVGAASLYLTVISTMGQEGFNLLVVLT